jgi:tetratricopeptide (TPR) repeat protein
MFFLNPDQNDAIQKESLNINIYEQNMYSQGTPIGSLLEKAGLISLGEIEIALEDQKHNSNLRLGQILAIKGWIKQETADFFASQWHSMITEVKRGETKYKLGQCLEKAGLLNNTQITEILDLQKKTNKCFGQIAVEMGYIKESTLDLFIQNLCNYNHKYLNETIEGILYSVKKLIKIQKYSLGIIELRKALKYNPHHSGIHALFSIIYIKQKQFTMASIHIKKAERTNPNEPLLFEAKMLLQINERFNSDNNNKVNSVNQENNDPTQKKSSFLGFFTKKLAIA